MLESYDWSSHSIIIQNASLHVILLLPLKRGKSYITGHLYCKSFENNDFFIQRFLLFFICSFISIKGKLSISHLHLQRLENGFNRNCFVSMNFLKEETMLIHVEPV